MIKIKLRYPCDSKRITSPFGVRIHPITKVKSFHSGLDFGAVKPGIAGDNIYSVADGVVARAYVSNSYGNCVIINHNGFVTLYAHMKTLKVKAGDVVKAGTVIGLMGSTGSSTAVHLHFELREVPKFDNSFFDKNADGSLKGAIDSKPYLQ